MTEASFYYQTASGGLGQEFLDDLQRTINAVRERPKLGRPVSRGLRQAPLQRFPFLLIYAEEEEILVVAVAHQNRRPGYWRAREWSGT